MSTAEQVYEQSVKCLPLVERLRLAALILNDFPPRAIIDYSEEWTDEDLADFTRATWASIDFDDGQAGSSPYEGEP